MARREVSPEAAARLAVDAAEAKERIAAAQVALARAKGERDAVIRTALVEGVPYRAIAEAAGVTLRYVQNVARMS
jgi:DNA-directed RNA polymerase specialized sigma24 family protein